VGVVGPGVETRHEYGGVWTDHTDVRPTMLQLLGLKDDYQGDGRVVTEILKGGATAKSLRQHTGSLEQLGAVYKQLFASFGAFSMNTLVASTGALSSSSVGDQVYNDTETAISTLTDARNALALQIRNGLWKAEFDNQPLDEQQIKDWTEQANGLIAQANALAGKFRSQPEDQKNLNRIKHFVVIHEENHSFDNLYGGWEGVNGLKNVHVTGSGDHVTQVGQDAARTPLACLPHAAGLVMGTYDTKSLEIYKYLHGDDHPKYAILDNFFQAAFGGSFLNHQWLIAAATPVDPTGVAGGAHAGLHSILDANNFPALRSPPASQLAT